MVDSIGARMVSTVNGQAVHDGTAVEQNPHGIPTLVYNCAKVPALCENVHQQYPLNTYTHTPQPGQSVTGHSTLQGRTHLLLHFDTGAKSQIQRGVACNTGWKKRHVCPETNQPHTVPEGAVLGDGSFPAARWNPNGLKFGDSGYNRIADRLGQFSGMMWTCDEFPFASSIEGGSGALTYCTPQNAACGGKNGLPAGAAFVPTEQDFQSWALSGLRTAVWTTKKVGIFRYHFRTEFKAELDPEALRVEWFGDGSGMVTPYGKRSIEDRDVEPGVVRVIESIYGNGSVETRYENIHKDEYKLLRRSWDEYLVGNGSAVNLESGDTKQSMGQMNDRAVDDGDDDQTKLSRVWLTASGNGTNPARQGYEALAKSPPLPILEIARDFVEEQKEDKPVEEPYIIRVVEASDGADNSTTEDGNNLAPRDEQTEGWMFRRQSQRQCDPTTPCPDGSCCNKKGRCGYGDEICGPKVCVSNCKATALCGKDSLEGKVKCPLNVCCSAYGYCGVEDTFCEGAGKDAPCQKGFGSCNKIDPPSCGGRSAFARSIGYYQFANVRDRQCNRISPKQIRTEGFTHLYGAFATIDPSTFAVKPWHPDDVALYKEFTALKKKGLETWIAIGGWTFNDPGATRTTFSDLAANPTRRTRFIKSVASFLELHGFQGVDLDWEYPGAPDRGGRKEDTDNYVSLLKEMRAVFGTKYGISVAIPTSYWYLRWFKPKEMEPYVDYFGVMTYDLHGPWDEDVKQIGRVILGHTNVPEIANWSLPLYYDGVSPAKLNMGLAYYARGYTVADSNCNGVGCDWASTSRPAPCTNFGGVMSLEEIERLIDEEPGMSTKLLAKDMMMELKFGDQWIGYDNDDTIQMKKRWASSRCFGGTMVWSVDMYSGSGSGDTPDDGGSGDSDDPGGNQGTGSGLIYIDPEIWDKDSPEVKCVPPCTMVLPPSSLKKPITLTIPPYETSLDVAWSGTDGWHSTIQKTTLTVPVVTITTVDVWHITVREKRTDYTNIWSTFPITPSIRLPTFTITNKLPETTKDSVTRPPGTRTITPPPYPWTYTPPDPPKSKPTSDTPGGGDDDDDDDGVPPFPIVTWRPGKPGPICKKNCGKNCLIFCSYPCLLDCPDGGTDFPDPQNPKPPGGPKPTGKPVKPKDPPKAGTEPENEEHETDEQQCAIELGLPLPTWRDPDATTSVKPKPTPPKSSPKPDPTPPSPNPDTEELDCYNSGQFINRGLAIEALEYFCDRFEGQVLDATRPETERTLMCKRGVHCIPNGNGCFVDVVMSVTVKNGCRFTMGGKGAKSECGRILRRMIDECDTSSTQFKQGGKLSSNCADWRFDPNNRWNPTAKDQC
ncbi:hypothetical protein G7Z17_g84 [Cylindrodendrum hubeiense]|uniref:chitinase n=1 Tax=Cylindrodendrum hubeiense TaxID=595255 RepID=A0A9P5LLC2_9HYPO|nr:hypothetical protein G7Z17_g84 [Cylindrodendrum hubeiense]